MQMGNWMIDSMFNWTKFIVQIIDIGCSIWVLLKFRKRGNVNASSLSVAWKVLMHLHGTLTRRKIEVMEIARGPFVSRIRLRVRRKSCSRINVSYHLIDTCSIIQTSRYILQRKCIFIFPFCEKIATFRPSKMVVNFHWPLRAITYKRNETKKIKLIFVVSLKKKVQL